jgi:hypothetical protein
LDIYDPYFPPNRRVTFVSYDGRYELPNPKLLEVHAAVARILHLTGAGEYIEKVLRDREDIAHLATDGSTDVTRLLLAFEVAALSV